MRWVRIFFLAGLFAFLTAMGSNSPAGSDKKTVSPFDIEKLDGAKAPDFSMKDVNGKTVALSALRGKVVLLNFWATWCPPCIAEMPTFNRLYLDMRSRGLEVVAVSTDRSLNSVKEYLSKKNFSFPVVFDEGKTVAKQYKVFSMPTTFLIDKNGIIVEKFFGEYDWTDQEMKKKIEKLF